MRVIAGKARRIILKTADGMDTRPTTDRIKETLFNMIGSDLYDTRFLDLFSGSGAIAIEALSRGAAQAVLVEKSKDAASVIRTNLKNTKLEAQAELMICDCMEAIGRLETKKKAFDFIFMDPPYDMGLEKTVLERIMRSGSFPLLNEDTTIIVEASLATDFTWVEELGLELVKEKLYKTNKHVFLKRKQN